MPRDPFCQIAAKAARPTRVDSTAMPSAPKNVASAGFISRKPKRTIRIETRTATTENTARLRDHVARLDTGSDRKGAEKLRAIGYFICRVNCLPHVWRRAAEWSPW